MPWNYYIMGWVVVLRCEIFVLEEWDICLEAVRHLLYGCKTNLKGPKHLS
jgi:hypothetical protein